MLKRKKDVYLVKNIRPPSMVKECVHIDYDYWDRNGKKYSDSVCVNTNYFDKENKESVAHEGIIDDINKKYRNKNVEQLQQIVNKEFKL